jgi:hypothetical protein
VQHKPVDKLVHIHLSLSVVGGWSAMKDWPILCALDEVDNQGAVLILSGFQLTKAT